MNNRMRVSVLDKIATKVCDTTYVCGNSDYVIDFTFDAEWDDYTIKTARFVPGNNRPPIDVVFEGNSCEVPVISNTLQFRVGVFAGDLHTTTPACVPAKKSILCESGTPEEPASDVYAQIMEKINDLEADVPPEQIEAAVNKYLKKNPIDVGITEEQLTEAVESALTEAKESGDFKGEPGEPGKDGYTPVKGIDYFDGERGEKGDPGYTPKKGVDYFDGARGEKGESGYTPIKGVDYFDGEKGEPGADGKTPVKGVDYFDGKDGAPGAPGKDGVSATHSWSGTTLTVTSASGTSSANLKGDKGDTGATGADGYTPVRGTDYWTSEDISSIVNQTANLVVEQRYKRTYKAPENFGAANDSTLLEIITQLPEGSSVTFWINDNKYRNVYSEIKEQSSKIGQSTPYGIVTLTKYSNVTRVKWESYLSLDTLVNSYTTVNNKGWAGWKILAMDDLPVA